MSAKLRTEPLAAGPTLEAFLDLFEPTSFIVLGSIRDDHREMLDAWGADFRDYAGGFINLPQTNLPFPSLPFPSRLDSWRPLPLGRASDALTHPPGSARQSACRNRPGIGAPHP